MITHVRWRPREPRYVNGYFTIHKTFKLSGQSSALLATLVPHKWAQWHGPDHDEFKKSSRWCDWMVSRLFYKLVKVSFVSIWVWLMSCKRHGLRKFIMYTTLEDRSPSSTVTDSPFIWQRSCIWSGWLALLTLSSWSVSRSGAGARVHSMSWSNSLSNVGN